MEKVEDDIVSLEYTMKILLGKNKNYIINHREINLSPDGKNIELKHVYNDLAVALVNV